MSNIIETTECANCVTAYTKDGDEVTSIQEQGEISIFDDGTVNFGRAGSKFYSRISVTELDELIAKHKERNASSTKT